MSKAKLFDFFAAGLEDTNGDPLSGYKVRTYATDGSTAKVVWEDRDKTLPTALGKSSFTLDTTGRASVYGDGLYTVKIWTDTADPDTDSPYKEYTGVEALSNTLNDFDEDTDTTTGLTWGYEAGLVRDDNNVVSVSSGNLALTDNSTNYIEVDREGTVSSNTTGFTPDSIPLWEIVTSSGEISSRTDKRTWIQTNILNDFDENTVTTTGLTWGYKPGSIRDDNSITAVSSGTVSLTDDSTNYIEVDKSGTVSANTDGFTAGKVPIRQVVTSSGSQTTSTDKRAWLGQQFPGIKGQIDPEGFILSNGTDSDHDIDISTGEYAALTDGTNYKLFKLSSGLTKQIDANWTEGTDAGGFPSGLTLSADTHYNVFLIGKDDGTADAGFDTASDASNLLADATAYSWYRRILSVFTDGSSNIRAFLYYSNSNVVLFVLQVLDIDDTTLTTDVAETATVSVPPDQMGIFNFAIQGGTCDGVYGDIRNPNTSITGTLFGGGLAIYTGAAAQAVLRVGGQTLATTDNSSQISYVGDINNGTSLDRITVDTVGWIDSRQ